MSGRGLSLDAKFDEKTAEMRKKRLEELRGVLQSPEDVILCRIIEERVFGKYGSAGEEYEKVVKQIVEKMKDEKTRSVFCFLFSWLLKQLRSSPFM